MSRPGGSATPDTVALISAAGVDHQVSDAELGLGQPDGRYRALCDEVFTVAALSAPAERRCRGCLVELVPQPDEHAADSRRQRRSVATWAHALLGRLARLEGMAPSCS
ncbi:hypothetical protein [Pseudonocardia sp. HH130629-09]|uniref:hypothetical protein n=1 Tax=Pseudonocardia sp. HH130629-09 TaxID=1641402 RepID=UPI0006CB51B5|nr:hypothetical protein [Pseudonocardia sp. HH130629-09]ALE86541.1 hypothetical protein XF36_28210 [Pseudonocardia sp. HH130629-09]